MSENKIDHNATLAFLDLIHPKNERTVCCFRPNDGVCAKPGDRNAILALLNKRAGCDTYFTLARTRGQPTTTPNKDQITGSCWAWAEFDPPEGEDHDAFRKRMLAKLESVEGLKPSLVVDSGRGLWAYWRIEDEVGPDELEAINLGLAQQFPGADHVHNCNRVGRLPGTMNTKTKRVAHVVWHDENSAYSAESLPHAKVVDTLKVTTIDADIQQTSDLAELDKWCLPGRVKIIINHGKLPDEPKQGDNSRSAWVFDVACNLVRCCVPDGIILGILLDSTWGISESVIEKGGGAERYARRQVGSAHSKVAQDQDEELTVAPLEFQTNEKGVPHANNQHNIGVALDKLGVKISYDEFSDRMLVAGLPGYGPGLQDPAVEELYLTIDRKFAFRPGKDYFWMVISNTARKNSFHPVRDYLESVTWDGTPRLHNWLSVYGEAEDTPYTRAVGSLMLLAAVRRVRQPGCKFDEMLVLRSAQGTGKSTALATLCPNPDWFSDDLPLNADTKVAIEQMRGRWIVEAAELKGMRQAKVEHMKAFLSRQTDRARLAYDRIATDAPRQCIFVGTTNSERFLLDGTGNRRFWPVPVGFWDLEALQRDRDQLWAEAAQLEAEGASIRLDPALYPAAMEAQEEHRLHDPFAERLQDVLGDWQGKIRSEDVWAILGVQSGNRTQVQNNRMGEAMRELGWQRKKLRFGGPSEWAYIRGPEPYERLYVDVTNDEARIETQAMRNAF